MTGTLRVSLNLQSMFLRDTLRADVRDARLELVSQVADGKELSLTPGLYHVSAVLDDGRTHSKVVQVASGARVDVGLSSDAERDEEQVVAKAIFNPPDVYNIDVEGIVSGRPPRALRGSLHRAFGLRTYGRSSADANWVLSWVHGANLKARDGDQGWTFDAPHKSDSVPVVHLTDGSQSRWVSLPVNYAGYNSDEQACTVQLEPSGGGLEPRAFIPPCRDVSSTIQQMMMRGHLFHVQNLVLEATDLLLHKYQDPVGATLGALVLFQSGVLEKHSDWLENLRRDFAWMPDAKILTAALAVQSGKLDLAVENLRAASVQRPMFTLSFAIMIDLLRRWRHDEHAGEIRELLVPVADHAASVDWGAFTFTVRAGDAE